MKNNLNHVQTIVFLHILDILKNDKNKNARKKIYELYIDKKFKKHFLLDQKTKSLIEQLNGDFDEISFLTEQFDLHDLLFQLYSDTIRRVWIILESSIEREKNERKKNDPAGIQFGNHFRELALKAKKYREKNNLQEPGFTDLRKF
jgi:hypothetical protein